MGQKIFEGRWEEIVKQVDLRGKHVKVIVNDTIGDINISEIESPVESDAGAAWVKQLEQWANSHKPLGHIVDDSRDTIYEDMIRDPR
jgi:hypothetical protein